MARTLGIDYGVKRVGIAISDETGEHVFPRELIENKGQTALFATLGDLVKTEGVEKKLWWVCR